MCFNNTYGSVCHDLWNEPDARVVCRQLGFSDGGANALSSAHYNSSSGPIFLNNVRCEGHESSLMECDLDRDITECDHSQDAGVSCRGIHPIPVIRIHKTMSCSKNSPIGRQPSSLSIVLLPVLCCVVYSPSPLHECTLTVSVCSLTCSPIHISGW